MRLEPATPKTLRPDARALPLSISLALTLAKTWPNGFVARRVLAVIDASAMPRGLSEAPPCIVLTFS